MTKEKVKKSFKSVEELNYAWQFHNTVTSEWEQFQCTECIGLEFDYQVYRVSGNEEFKCSKIIQGTVDLQKLELLANDPEKVSVKVRRTKDNIRHKRPQGEARHNPFNKDD